MFVVVVQWNVPVDKADWFEERLLQQADDTLAAEPSCLRFDVCRASDPAGRFLLYEVYAQASDFDAHLQTPHFLRFSEEAAPVTLAKSVETYGLCAP